MTEKAFAQCMSKLKSGDMQGLRQVYEEYGKMVYSAALRICRDPYTAEDVTSEFFLRLRSAASVYREGSGHKKWLLVSVKNLTLDMLRKQSREIPSSVQGEEESHPLSEIPDSADTEEKVASEMWAAEMLDRLSEERREIIYLKIYCGLTFAEISEVLQVPVGTAAWRYSMAVKELKKICEEVR